jgi:uroporphyrin-III C-methyltransferase
MANSIPVNPLSQATKAAKRATATAILSIIISIAVIIGLAIGWQTLQTMQKKLGTTQQTHSSTNAELTQLQQQLNQQQLQLTKLQNTVTNVLDSKVGMRRQQLLSQVAYLIHLANLHLVIGHDATTARKILMVAQQRLAVWQIPNLLPLKQALSQDIARIAALPTVDKTKLVSELDQINNQIQQLNIVPANRLNLSTNQTPDNEKVKSNNQPWYQKVGSYFSNLKSLITIRHHQQKIVPLITPSQEAFLKLNIQSKMLQAQWAILHRNNNLYQASLKKIQDWLSTYFPDSKEVQPIIQQLANLQKTNIAPKLPDIHQSLLAINQATGVANKPTPKTENKADQQSQKNNSKPTTPDHQGVAI